MRLVDDLRNIQGNVDKCDLCIECHLDCQMVAPIERSITQILSCMIGDLGRHACAAKFDRPIGKRQGGTIGDGAFVS